MLQEKKRVLYYFLIRQKLSLKNILFSSCKNHKFLFILCGPYCGSTLLNQIISSSSNVSCNNKLGVREGQLLPGVKHFMFTKKRWQKETKYKWKEIKKTWLKYWDHSKIILLEKSAPNLIRVDEIKKTFKDAYFIIMVRNPYAQAEGIIRRNNATAEYAAKFALNCLKQQKINIESKHNSIWFSYEDLCDNSTMIFEKMVSFLPETADIDIYSKFKAHNFKTKNKMSIQNLNAEKISILTKEQIKTLNSYFVKEKKVLEFFNYSIVD